MKVNKIAQNIKLKPTEKKVKQAKHTVDEYSALPKEMPIDQDVYIKSDADQYEDVKNSILISISNMIRGNK